MGSPLDQQVIAVLESASVGEARRRANQLAVASGFGETDAGRVALVATEAANNLLRHGGGGEILLRQLDRTGRLGVEVVALDRGPGIVNLAEAMRDGHSTGGTSGTGLGALERLSERFEVYTQTQRGTVVMAELWPERAEPAAIRMRWAAVNVPVPGEEECGDGWRVRMGPRGLRALVVDGLGHGVHAALAARRACEVFDAHPDAAPVELLEACHDALRATRGAAVAVAALDLSARQLEYVGLGNIAATMFSGNERRSLVSLGGTAGAGRPRLRLFQYPWPTGATLVIASDGLSSRWDLAEYPGLLGRSPALLSAVLYRDHRRERDDVTVLTLRETT